MCGLRRILTLVLFPLFLVGCGSGGEEPDGVLRLEVEIDCSSPVFTRTEPLPSGIHPEGWITTGNNYWDCDGSREYYHADGTFTGRFTDTDTEEYDFLVDFWRACRAGTRLPGAAGSWVVVDDKMCLRFDIIPGIIICGDIFSEPDGRSATTGGDLEVIQYGRVIDSFYAGSDTCYLEQE